MPAAIKKTINLLVMSVLMFTCLGGVLPGCSGNEESEDTTNYETPLGEEVDQVEALRKKYEKK